MTTTTEAGTEALTAKVTDGVRRNAQTVLALAYQHADGLSLTYIGAGTFDGEVAFSTNEDAETFAALVGAELDDDQNAHYEKVGKPYRSWATPDGTVRVSGWGQ
jgi:hypothetical protein